MLVVNILDRPFLLHLNDMLYPYIKEDKTRKILYRKIMTKIHRLYYIEVAMIFTAVERLSDWKLHLNSVSKCLTYSQPHVTEIMQNVLVCISKI